MKWDNTRRSAHRTRNDKDAAAAGCLHQPSTSKQENPQKHMIWDDEPITDPWDERHIFTYVNG